MKIINTIAPIIVASVLIYTLSFKSFITFNYFINQAEITELFCVNKEKPKLQCNGKCHLTKELIKTENENSNLPFTPTSNEINIELFFDIESYNKLRILPLTINNKYNPHLSCHILATSIDILTPPPQV